MGWIWGAVRVVVVGGTATFLVQKAWWDSEDIPVLREAIAHDQGFEGTDEYDPVGDDHTNLPEKAPRGQILPPTEDSGGAVLNARIAIEKWSAEERIVAVNFREPMRGSLRLLHYPAWRVEANSKPVTPDH